MVGIRHADDLCSTKMEKGVEKKDTIYCNILNINGKYISDIFVAREERKVVRRRLKSAKNVEPVEP